MKFHTYEKRADKIVAAVGTLAALGTLVFVILYLCEVLPAAQPLYLLTMVITMCAQAHLQRESKWVMWSSIACAVIVTVCALLIWLLK